MKFNRIPIIFLLTVIYGRYVRCGGVFDFADNSILDYSIFPKAVLLIQQCGGSDIVLCLKEKTLNYVDNVNSRNLKIFDGLYLKQTDEAASLNVTKNQQSRNGKSIEVEPLPDEPTERSQRIDELLIEKALNFLKSRILEIRTPESTIDSIEETVEEGRRRRRRQMIPYLIMMKLKAAAVLHMVMNAIAIMALKAIVMAKIALVISIAIGLKKLNSHSEHRSFQTQKHDVISSFLDSVFDAKPNLNQNTIDNGGNSLAYSAHHQ